LIDNFNQEIITSANWGNDNGAQREVKIKNRPKEVRPNLKYSPLSHRINNEKNIGNRALKKVSLLSLNKMKMKNYLSQFNES